MAISTVAANGHLFSTGTGFTNTANPFSVTVWINANWAAGTGAISMVGIYDGTPVGTGTPTTDAGLQIGTRAGTNDIACWVYGGTILVQAATGASGFSNTWILVTYTWDGTTHSLYRNNTLLATSTTTFTPVNLTQVFINGYPPTGTVNETAVFSLDAYSYFSRALTAPEVQTIYNAGGSRHGIINSLVAKYEFDELSQGTATTLVIDITGNGNNLTSSGTGITYTYTGSYADSNIRPVC